MRSFNILCLLAWIVTATDIQVIVNDGPSVEPGNDCFGNHAVEKGDWVVAYFNASYHETSPSGTPGQLITSSAEHSDDGSPMDIPLGTDDEALRDRWESALVGYCYDDHLTLIVPAQYLRGEIFELHNIPTDAIVKLDVYIDDILVDEGEVDDFEYEDEQEEEEL